MPTEDAPVVRYDVVEKGGRVIEEGLSLDDARDLARRVELNGHEAPDVVPSEDQPESSGMQVDAPEGLAGDDGATGDDAPNKSASREEWDEYARSKGIDPDEYATKDDLIEAAT